VPLAVPTDKARHKQFATPFQASLSQMDYDSSEPFPVLKA